MPSNCVISNVNELTASELSSRICQEGLEYTLLHYYSIKDFKTIKNPQLKVKTLELINSVKLFQNALERARLKELDEPLEQ
jgi:hypothetical protein